MDKKELTMNERPINEVPTQEVPMKERPMIERMHTCDLYLPDDEEIAAAQTLCLEKLYDFNATRPLEMEKRTALLQEMFAEIGAGSIVTKDIPANVIAVGNPCRVLREINDHDKEYYFKDRKIEL